MAAKALYLLVSNDEFELPMCVADNVRELAAMVGCKPKTISAAISHSKQGKRRTRYRRILIDDEED